jgi:D-alanyl-D-alanine carboxypeptidase/D-alanyl-D-alanine-endopeptidase (penicillin-binding protein 4)
MGRAAHLGPGLDPRRRVGQNAPVPRRLLVAVVACFLAAPVAQATAPTLPLRLERALTVPHVAAEASAAIAIDLETFEVVYERNADLSLLPASNEKLAVTFAALRELGPSYRFRTEVLGVGYQDGEVWNGDLVLKGFGDPTLSSLQLTRLAAQLRELGIRRVTGRVLGDETWFDSRRMVAGWLPWFYVNESPPLSALAIDRDRYHGLVGKIPPLSAAARFQELLHARGIVAGDPGTGRAPPGSFSLAVVYSDPLPDILAAMDIASDNYTAELLLKTLGAELGGAGTSAAGAAVVMRSLRESGVPLGGVRVVDGSGLSRSDRLTARALTAILVAAFTDPDLREPLWEALPIAGVNGTLEDRLRLRPARGAVRAKTGTTSRASALSGYVRDRYAFAVLQNGRPVSTYWARTAQDRFVQALAAEAVLP